MSKSEALFGYIFWAIFVARVAEDDDARERSLSYVLRALPGVGIFEGQSDEDIALDLLLARRNLEDSFTDDDIDLHYYCGLHLKSVQNAGLSRSLFNFLISMFACCGQSGELQLRVFLDASDGINDPEGDQFKERIRIFREFHNK